MPSFGIVGEGVTDQIVVDNILLGYFGDEEPIVNYVQPPLDKTGETRDPAPGGWGLVLKFFELGEHRRALQFNDYLVVQIDTDVSEQKGYDVPHREGGRELEVAELVMRVTEKFKGIIGDEFLRAHGHRFLFAVAVHGIECWLLPLLYEDNRATKTTGCLDACNRERIRRNKPPLSAAGHKSETKNVKAYQEVAREYAKRKRLYAVRDKNPSLALFIAQLDTSNVKAQPGAAPLEGLPVEQSPGASAAEE
ncbi:hypothetical protein [Archangium violaceum]|uniref:hypothetical protein n=1 Tax=Archangium violaceum TaxID=83451 RepID=UPI0006990676|nr:hypothetical protein [Archangium violaceum]